MKLINYTVLLSLILYSCSNSNNSQQTLPTEIKGVWLYDLSNFDNSSIINTLTSNKINAVFISTDPYLIISSETYINKLKDFVSRSKQNNIQVHAMICEDPIFTKAENHNTALVQIDNIISYNEQNPEYSLKGIHLDVEPHALDEWKNANEFNDGIRESLMQEFLSLLTKARQRIESSGLSLSAAITWWYDSKYRDGLLPSGNAELYKTELDFVVIMSYSDALSVYDQAKDEMNILPTIFGFYVPNYTNKEALEQDIIDTATLAEGNSNYLGTCIFQFEDY